MRVRIVETGLVGSSLEMALTGVEAGVLLGNLNSSHAKITTGLGAGRVTTDDEPVDAIVVASSPTTIARVVTRVLERHPEAVIIDVESVESFIVRAVTATSDRLERYVPGHPMAGSQLIGPLTISADLFTDRTWIVTPQTSNSPEDVDLVRRLARLCGARVVELDTDLHDGIVAQVSHVPRLISILTASHLRGVPGENLILAGQSIWDVTRIVGSDPRLWRQIITTNPAAVRRELSEAAVDLEYLVGVLGQAEPLEAFLILGQHDVMALCGKHGQMPEELAAVTAEVLDEPCALTRLFGDVDDFGFSVEDFELTHDAVREVGYLSIFVRHPQAERFREDLKLRGWRAWLDRKGI